MANIFKKAYQVFKKNFTSADAPEITKYGKRSDSSKQSDKKINPEILRDYFMSDPLIRSAIQTDVDNVCTEYYFELDEDTDEAEAQRERAEKIFYRDNFIEKWRNVQLCLGVYDDSYHEIQTYIKDSEVVFDSFVLETPSIKIKNKKAGDIDYYTQTLQGKEVAQLKPAIIIHYRFNAFGDRDYGLSLVSTVLYSSAIRKFIEKYNGSIFQNHKPRGVWMFPGEMPEDLYNLNVDLIIEGKNDPNKDLFLRGSNIDYKNFLDQKDVDFMRGYVEARTEILIGLGVPPIMLCIPEGSNKANSQEQVESYDRRVLSKQNAFAYKINTELLPKLGLDKIKFRAVKSSKRDEERELNIVNKMKGIVTLNEARKQIGYPELDVAEFPEADQIWKDSSNQFGMTEESEPGTQESDKEIKKSVKLKKKLKTPILSEKAEEKAIKPFKEFYKKIFSKAKRQVDLFVKDGKFKKAADSDKLISSLEKVFDTSGIGAMFATFTTGQYLMTGKKMSKQLDRKFQPNKEEIKFLKTYNLDLVKAKSQREISQIKQILEVGLINNQSATTIKQALDGIRETALNHTATLVRTEMNRANNMGSLTSMKEAGVKVKKYLEIVSDKRTSQICRTLIKKYGTEEQAIDLNKEFKAVVNGKIISKLSPPFHPNCRDVLVYVIE